MKYLPLLLASLLLSSVTWGQDVILEPGQSMTVTVSIVPNSPKLTAKERSAIRQLPIRPATKVECNPFPCRMGAFRTYICPAGYALLNQWDDGLIASSIPDGEATMQDVWDKDKRPLSKCQNLADWKMVLALRGHDGVGLAGVKKPIITNLEKP